MFWQLALATCWWLSQVAKNACLSKSWSVKKNKNKKTFLVFPRTFYDYSLSFSTETHPNTPCHSLQTPFLHFFTSKSSRKRYGFSFPHLISHVLSFIFVNICVDILFFSLLVCFGFWVVLVWIVEVLFLCELVLVDRFIYYHLLVSLR